MDILHAMMVRSSPQEIYRALTEQEGLSAWFGPECRAGLRPGSTVEVYFHDRHNYSLKFEIMELEPGSRVVWKVIQAIPGWDDFPSTVTWTLFPYESSTIVHLRHSGWPDGHEAFPSVSFKWAEFMIALRAYLSRKTQCAGSGFHCFPSSLLSNPEWYNPLHGFHCCPGY